MNAFLDSSFIAKLYLPESNSPRAIALAASLSGIPFICSLADVEVASAILRRPAADAAKVIYARYRANRGNGLYRIFAMDDATFLLARELMERHARQFSLRSLDAIQIAAALLSGATHFITIDANQGKAALAEGLIVLRP